MTAICRYPVPDVATLPDDLRTRILEVQDKAGFVPNVFLALARRPDELRAFLAYHDALLLREGGLSKAEKEMIIVATSGANRCLYCVVAHGAILRIYAKAPRLADQLATNPLKAEVSPRQAAMLAFAMKVCLDAQSICEADYAALHAAGLDDEDAWDITSIVGLFGMSNRIANTISLMPNDEFYLMGRVPKVKG
ncbi:peroxidase-related enzyme [Inhella gelatinilytica]|uniref:Peroxidase-related enzyme n=1 Tax=Inhella gelatinilytica TaxID=2795030 RepID=A0A931ND08_9BURK|nr:peroxidase-related enzyme [Inhella gelatinilytica]MBH9552587.1 peroxidase-related enzyme [Inhella gelatinilytica]